MTDERFFNHINFKVDQRKAARQRRKKEEARKKLESLQTFTFWMLWAVVVFVSVVIANGLSFWLIPLPVAGILLLFRWCGWL